MIIISFVSIDLIIKAFIYFNLMHIHIRFFDERVGFTPMINTEQLSLFNNELNLGLQLQTLIVLNIVILIGLPFIYLFMKKREYTNCHFENAFLMITAGTFCSLIDKIVLGGSLDYILLSGHIHDLKDFYLYLSLVFICNYMVSYFINKKKELNQKNN